jgi:hypothetical protein
MTDPTVPEVPVVDRVVRTRGKEQRDLASCLNPDAVLAGPDLVESCVDARADLLVTSRIGSFDLTSVAVPSGFDASRIGSVVAAIGTGPHSALAAQVAFRIGQTLTCPVELVSVVPGEERPAAERVLERLVENQSNASWRIVSSGAPVSVIALTEPRSLVVIGAPRGNWIHRHVFSPAAKLQFRAPAGTVMVRCAPRRVFHYAERPEFWIGPQLQLSDAAEIMQDAVAPVVDDGFLVGVIRQSAIATQGATTARDVMEDAPLITNTDPATALDEVAEFFDGAPIPVVNAAGRFIASVDPARTHGSNRTDL